MNEPTASHAIEAHNRQAWDERVARQQRFARATRDDELHEALEKLDRHWLGGDLRGRRLLCLAAGGGRQSVVYALAGAEVTVVDLSPAMLSIDRAAAAERGLAMRIIEASMDRLTALASGEFDIVVQPVSTCYVADIAAVYREVARVTAIGGLYISQHKQPTSLQTSVTPTQGHYQLTEPYYRQGPLPPVSGSLHREQGTLEFLHRWEELIGGMCRQGFVIEDLTEPLHAKPDEPGSFADRSRFVAPYVRIKARRVAALPDAASAGAASIVAATTEGNVTQPPATRPRPTLWTPEQL